LITVGRDASCNFVIDSPRVSGSHCQIRFFADRFEVTDLGSSNGTFVGVERTRVQAPTTVFPGQPLFLGTMEISPSEVAGRMGLQWPAAAPAAAPSSAGRAVVVGRDPECDFVIDSPKISGRHCQLRFAGDRVELTDLGSSNGTFVGEERARVQGPVMLFAGQVAFMGSIPLPIDEIARRFGVSWGQASRGAAPTVAEPMPVSPEANRLAAERAALEQERMQFEQAKLAAAAPPRAAAAPAPASKPKNQVAQIAVLLLLLVGGGVFFFMQQQDGSGGGSSDSAQTPQDSAQPPAEPAAGGDTPVLGGAAAGSTEPSTEAPVVVERGDSCVITWRGRDLVTDDSCAEGAPSNLSAIGDANGQSLPFRAGNALFYIFGGRTNGMGNGPAGYDLFVVGVTADDAWATQRFGGEAEISGLSANGDGITLKLTKPEGAVTCQVKAGSAKCSKPKAPPKPKVLDSQLVTVSGKLKMGSRANGDKSYVETNSGDTVDIDNPGDCAISDHYEDWADVELLCEDLADGTRRCACKGLHFAD